MLGEIVLHPSQREAAARVTSRLEVHGGCLLADAVGRGKTFTALAVAARWRFPLLVIPASLREMWQDAMRRAGRELPIVTHEALSRGVSPPGAFDGVIVDESHHFRNAATQRHAALAALCAWSELLLLSATPVQNSVADLRAQLSLFLGSVASRLDAAQLAAHLVRVESPSAERALPRAIPPAWARLTVDDSRVLHAILALPPPVPLLDAGDAGALRTIVLVRAWASSRSALRDSVARRQRRLIVLAECLDAGRVPSAGDLRRYVGDGCEESVQLGFFSLLMPKAVTGAGLLTIADAVSQERAALGALAALLRTGDDPDLARSEAVASLAVAHGGERLIAFTHSAATARAMFARLRGLAGVGVLTARGAAIASGRLTRRELLARFAPRAQRAPAQSHRETVSLLITTDLLAEGVNLQDASVVVHLDLPWNPARLEQRLGRVRRPNGAPVVSTYLLAPPASAAACLEVEQRLRHKVDVAERVTGVRLAVMPALTADGWGAAGAGPDPTGTALATLRMTIARWGAGPDQPRASTRRHTTLIAAVDASDAGWMALLSDGRLLCGDARGATIAPDAVAGMAARACGRARTWPAVEYHLAIAQAQRWMRSERLLLDCGAGGEQSGLAGRLDAQLSRALVALPRAERGRFLPVAAVIRGAMRGPLRLGIERAVEALLADAARRDGAWIERVRATVCHGCHERDTHAGTGLAVVALLLVGPSPAAGC
jgi:hypothetical protein